MINFLHAFSKIFEESPVNNTTKKKGGGCFEVSFTCALISTSTKKQVEEQQETEEGKSIDWKEKNAYDLLILHNITKNDTDKMCVFFFCVNNDPLLSLLLQEAMFSQMQQIKVVSSKQEKRNRKARV